jgi:hypothetical protein
MKYPWENGLYEGNPIMFAKACNNCKEEVYLKYFLASVAESLCPFLYTTTNASL